MVPGLHEERAVTTIFLPGQSAIQDEDPTVNHGWLVEVIGLVKTRDLSKHIGCCTVFA